MSAPHTSAPTPLGAKLAQWLRTDHGRLAVECLAALALAVTGVALLWFHAALPGAVLVVLWAGWLAALVGLRLAGFFHLFGPVLFYDLVRTARRRRNIAVRCLYAGALLLLLCWVYFIWVVDTPDGRIAPNRLSDFASSFFYMFMGVQFVVVVLLTPAYTAGAIAEEKERRTLEFVLATDLDNREIVLSKLASRLVNITFLILTGLPVLSALQFLGGVDPNLTVAGFAVTGLTMASLGGLGIFNSVQCRRPRDAIALTYVGAATYLILSGFAKVLLAVSGVGGYSVLPFWTSPTVQDLADWLAVGNILTALNDLARTVASGGRLDTVLPEVLGTYAIFHGVLAVALPLWATFRLRAIFLKETYGAPKKLPLPARVVGRPRVGRYPMLWKELFAEQNLRLNWAGRIAVGLLVLGSFVPAGFILWMFFDRVLNLGYWPGVMADPWRMLGDAMNAWVRFAFPLAGILLLLAIAVRAAGSISGERDKRTFDELLTTPLSSSSILFSKWLGSILCVRWAWLWMAAVVLLGLLTGGISPMAVPFLVVAWCVYAAVFALIGMWFSMNCRTTLLATLWTLLAVLGVSVGHWLVTILCVYMPVAVLSNHSRGMNDMLEWLAHLQAGQTPPWVLGLLAFRLKEFEGGRGWEVEWMTKQLLCCLLGVISWAVAGGAFYLMAELRFRALTNREAVRRPDRGGFARRPPRPPRRRPVVEEPLTVLPASDSGDSRATPAPR